MYEKKFDLYIFAEPILNEELILNHSCKNLFSCALNNIEKTFVLNTKRGRLVLVLDESLILK